MNTSADNEKYIVIGDIHGCYEQLSEILEMAKKYRDHALIFLGDYIDRGLEAERVCKRIMGLEAICLKGNHEEMLIERALRAPLDTEDLLLQARITGSSFEWIRSALLPIYETEKYIFVHAGLDITKPMKDQEEFSFLWTRWDGDYYPVTQKTVIHGHSVIRAPEIVGNRININTGCGSGGHLTGLVLPEMEYLTSSVSAGAEHDWEKIREELEREIQELMSIEDISLQ